MAEAVVPVVVPVRQTICQAITMSLEDTQIHSVCSLILFACCLPFFSSKMLTFSKRQTIPNPKLEGFPSSSNCSSKSMMHLFLAAARICKPSSKGVVASRFPEELFNLKNAKKHVFRRGSGPAWKPWKAIPATFEMIFQWGLKAFEHRCFTVFVLWRCEVSQGGPKFVNVEDL